MRRKHHHVDFVLYDIRRRASTPILAELEGIKARNHEGQERRCDERQPCPDDKWSPAVRPHRSQCHDDEENRNIEEVGKGGHVPTSGFLQLHRHSPLLDRISCKTAKSHKIKPRDRVALDELECEKRNHSGQPRHPKKCPSSIYRDDQPRSRTEQQESAGDDKAIVQYRDGSDSLGEHEQLLDLSRAEIRVPDSDQTCPYQRETEQVKKFENRIRHGIVTRRLRTELVYQFI